MSYYFAYFAGVHDFSLRRLYLSWCMVSSYQRHKNRTPGRKVASTYNNSLVLVRKINLSHFKVLCIYILRM